MSSKTKTVILVVVAVAIVAAIILYAHLTSVGPHGQTAFQGPTEYRGSIITSTPPADIPTVLLPGQSSQDVSYYLNNQSEGGRYATTQTPAELSSLYKQDFASLGWRVVMDNESSTQAFISAISPSGSSTKAVSITMVQAPDGSATEVSIVIQK
jgi:hypothetical protein